MRLALHSTIKPGHIDDYREHHARIPDDLRAEFDRVGIRDWVIWRSGDRLFHLIDCDADFAAAIGEVAGTPADAAWQANIGRFVDRFFGPDGTESFGALEQVWSLEGQREQDRA
ncbi:MAG TPA: L-rhamnose mutarotase [Candidatus Lumbricidophila sp.]|nr:L-rhamnose mutarotase [Candidatus Lumbricidophila sp.]